MFTRLRLIGDREYWVFSSADLESLCVPHPCLLSFIPLGTIVYALPGPTLARVVLQRLVTPHDWIKVTLMLIMRKPTTPAKTRVH
jgi:hypothetical protein